MSKPIDFSSYTNDKTSFGEALRNLRKSERMTTSELAEMAEVSQSYISQLENNVRIPSDTIIEQLSQALAAGTRYRDAEDALVSAYDTFHIEENYFKIYKRLTEVKKENETSKIKSDYLETIQNTDENATGISLSQDELTLIKNYQKLSLTEKKQLLDFSNFLIK